MLGAGLGATAVEALSVEFDLGFHIGLWWGVFVADVGRLLVVGRELFDTKKRKRLLIHLILKVLRNLHLDVLGYQVLGFANFTFTSEEFILDLLIYLRHHFDPQSNTLVFAL